MTLAIVQAFKDIGVINFEKGMELTPQFQKDVEGQVRISRRHVIYLILTSSLIPLFWYLAVWALGLLWLYSFFLGLFVLMEVAVHVRHLRNWYTARVYRREGGLSGSLTYSQRFSYLVSAFDLYIFAVLFALFFLLTFSFFFLGGAIACLRVGFGHGRLAGKSAPAIPSTIVQNEDSSPG
jgi:hypothetical protein